MTDLTTQVLKRCEFKPCEISKTNNQFKHGRRAENRYLMPLIRELCAELEAAEAGFKDIRKYSLGSKADTCDEWLTRLTAFRKRTEIEK